MKTGSWRRLGCGLLTLGLLLGMAACAGTGVPAEKREDGRRDEREPARLQTPALPERDAAVPPGKSYDDSLIADAYADAGDAGDEWGGSYHYEVRVPQLRSDSGDARALNAEIMERYGADAKSAPDPAFAKSPIGWISHWDGSLLSLELTVSRPDGEINRDIYYFDFADETRLSAEDVLARMGLSWESLAPALIRTAVRAHDRMMQAQNGPFTSALAADALELRAQTALAAQDTRLPFYPNGDGTLTVWLNLAVGAGAGWMQKAFVIDPNETAVPLSASYEFVTAEVAADGAVTVEYHERGDEFSGADYQKIHGFAFDTPYRIDGCFGRYTDLFIGNIGAGFEPYLFLLTENGTLEYVDLFRCARYETYVCGGPVYGLSDVTALSAGMGEGADQGCATVWALDASGAKHDLLESVYLSDGLPGGMTGEFAADSGGSRYSLSFSGIDGLRAQSGGTAYTGFPLRLGMNADGLVWALDLWDGAGGETLSICAILPGNGMLVLTQLAGGSPFGLAPGETMYLPESFG